MDEITDLLRRCSAGDGLARDALYRVLYKDFMRLARTHLARAGTISLDAPALVHEAYLRIAAVDTLPSEGRNLFLGYASKVMRSVLVDYVRELGAHKRGGDVERVTLTIGVADQLLAADDFERLHDAMQALEVTDDRAHRVVEMRYFAGLAEAEIAAVLDVSVPTVRRDWRKARAFLFEQLYADS